MADDVLDPDEEYRLRRLAEIQAEKARRVQAKSAYQALDTAKTASSSPAAGVATNVGMAVDDALGAGKPVPDLAKTMMPSLATPPADQRARMHEVATTARPGSTEQVGAELPRDLERYLTPEMKAQGYKEIVSGDQRLVVDKNDNAVATRDEFPSLSQHLDAKLHGQPGQASVIGLASNALGALVRPQATLINTALDQASNPGLERLASLPRDLYESAINKKGHTVSEGGLVAERGSGFGDVFRARAQHMLKDNPEATIGDVLGTGYGVNAALDATPYMTAVPEAQMHWLDKGLGWLHGVDQANIPDERKPIAERQAELHAQYDTGRKLRDMPPNDPAWDAIGELGGMFADPMNMVGGEAVKTAGLTAAKVAEKVPVVGGLASKVIKGVAVNDLTKAFSPESRLASSIAKDMEAAGVPKEEARLHGEKIAADRYAEEARVRAQGQMENVAQQQLLEHAAGAMKSSDADVARQLLEGGGKDVPMLVDKPDMHQLADIHAAAKQAAYDGLSTEDADLLKGYTPGSPAPAKLLFQRQRLADDLGLDVFQAHPWEKGSVEQQRQLLGAKYLGRALRRNLEKDQLLNIMGSHLRANGYFPHAPAHPLTMALKDKGVPLSLAKVVGDFADPFVNKLKYDPRARREMAALGDVDTLRAAAQAHAADIAKYDPQAGKVLRDFSRANGRPQAMGPGLVQYVRQKLEAHGALVEAPVGDVNEANRLAKLRGAHAMGDAAGQRIGFEQDPVRGVAAYRNAMAPEQMHAGIAEGVKQLVDLHGKPIVQKLDEAVFRPRYGTPDNLLLQKLTSDKRGIARAMAGEGGLERGVKRYLDAKGLEFIGEHDPVGKMMPALVNHVAPRAIYQDLLKVAPRLHPGLLEKFGNAMGRITNVWVPSVLNTPGFHLRNAFFGMFQVYLAIGSDITKPGLWNAARVVSAAAEKGGLVSGTIKLGGRTWKLADIVAAVRNLGIHEGGRVADMEGALRRGMMPYKDQWMRDAAKRLNPFSDRGLVTKEPLAKKLVGRVPGGGSTENVQRIMIYLQRIGEGKTSREAARDVVKYMFDYTGAQLSPGEKTLRRYMPFYQWVKQSLLLTVDQMLKNPGKYAAVNHMYRTMDAFSRSSNQDPRAVPDYLRSAGAVASPLQKDTPGHQHMVQMERPGTQASWLLDPLTRGDVGATAAGVLQQMNPLVGMGIERATGKYLFGDQPLDPNYRPEMSSQWTPQGMAERFAGMSSENIPGYLAKKWAGGYPSLGMEGVLGLVDPAWAQRNPRRSGVDETERMRNKVMGMLFGPRVTDTDAGAMALSERKKVADLQKAMHSREVANAKSRIAGE